VLPVSALVSVLTLLLVTKTAILVWAPRSVKKLPPLFEVPSLTPSFALSQFVVVTGVVVSALLTLFLAKFKERVALFASASFPLPEALDSSLLECPKKVLTFAGIKDCYTASTGQSKTLGNFVKATIDALVQTYTYLTPDLWTETEFTKTPYQEFTDYLKENSSKKKIAAQA